ncbi:MAG: GNAT family N-acetyltransferase [Verrucomicrobiales bacterium]
MITLRRLLPTEWDEVAELIYLSTNAWYERNLNHGIFTGPTSVARVFPEVYEAMDPGQCIVAVDGESGRLAGSCFLHPRETHFSLGIMNVHPDFAGRGVAGRILDEILRLADEAALPVRLVSSALNLDSFSLYTRAGFVPRAAFQDLMMLPGSGPIEPPPGTERIRPATMADVKAIADLELELAHIRRERDYAHFIENAAGIWRLSVIDSAEDPGSISGFLASVNHPGSHLLGPGIMRSDEDALALICAELNHHQSIGSNPVFLVPVDRPKLVQELYRRGARNCELHFCQVRGSFTPFSGVVMPTFMPETG